MIALHSKITNGLVMLVANKLTTIPSYFFDIFLVTFVVEQKKRTIVRVITYRLGAMIILMSTAWILTGNSSQTSAISATFALASSVFYYLHERAWIRTAWGIKS